MCFSLPLTVFLPPLPEVQRPNFLDIWNPWGKIRERSGLRLKIEKKLLFIKGVKLPRKKVCFLANFALLAGFFCIVAAIRIGQEMLCLSYAGFLKKESISFFRDYKEEVCNSQTVYELEW